MFNENNLSLAPYKRERDQTVLGNVLEQLDQSVPTEHTRLSDKCLPILSSCSSASTIFNLIYDDWQILRRMYEEISRGCDISCGGNVIPSCLQKHVVVWKRLHWDVHCVTSPGWTCFYSAQNLSITPGSFAKAPSGQSFSQFTALRHVKQNSRSHLQRTWMN